MPTDLVNTPTAYLRKTCPEVGEIFLKMREAISRTGPLDHATSELILLATFAISGFEHAFKIHAIKRLKLGVSKETLYQTVLIPMCAGSVLIPTVDALRWIDEVVEELASQ